MVRVSCLLFMLMKPPQFAALVLIVGLSLIVKVEAAIGNNNELD